MWVSFRPTSPSTPISPLLARVAGMDDGHVRRPGRTKGPLTSPGSADRARRRPRLRLLLRVCSPTAAVYRRAAEKKRGTLKLLTRQAGSYHTLGGMEPAVAQPVPVLVEALSGCPSPDTERLPQADDEWGGPPEAEPQNRVTLDHTRELQVTSAAPPPPFF